MAFVRFKVDGLQELDRKLREFEPKLARKTLRNAMKKAAEPMLHTARATAPIDTGLLVSSLKVKARTSAKKGIVGVRVATSDKDYTGKAFYASFYEYGTRHQPARPFMRQAFDENTDRSMSIAISEIKRGIEEVAK